MIYFTSDLHLTHSKIIQYCNRPFSSIDEHDKQLIDNWNSRVNKKDTVYMLGDFGFSPSKSNVEYLQKLANKLTGRIILIRGNHDTNIDAIKRFDAVKDIHVISYYKQKFIMCHYPLRSWQFINKGGIHLFAHCHSNMPPYYKSFDVGIDNIAKVFGTGKPEDYRPINIYEAMDYAKTLESPPWVL